MTASQRDEGSLLGPTIKTVIFTVVMPGSVIGLIPFLLSRWEIREPLLGTAVVRWVGLVLLLSAAPIFIDFLARFVWEGRGTPVPIAPTRHLVVHGPFQYVRNPGYVAVLTMIVGQGLFFGNVAVLEYAAGVAVVFHLFVVFYEEPTLRTQFGEEYVAYCAQVPRWIPRLTSNLRRA
jgi:protein-S-isoprenylcysteine O-methyltransferase Ste14